MPKGGHRVHDLSTDAGLQSFIDSLPDEGELRAELAGVLPERRCAVCGILLPLGSRKDMRTCSHAHRQQLYWRRLKARRQLEVQKSR
jgi:predicted nucleic acid-binding Zn ribbon protein